jgi:DNA modification methylase
MSEQDRLIRSQTDLEERRRKVIAARIAIGETFARDNENTSAVPYSDNEVRAIAKPQFRKRRGIAAKEKVADASPTPQRHFIEPEYHGGIDSSAPGAILGTMSTIKKIGPFALNTVIKGDCLDLIQQLPEASVDVLVTSPPYWGQRTSVGTGVEEDPRNYVSALVSIFTAVLPKLKPDGLVWINLGDAYNTPVNWRVDDRAYSSLGPDKAGLNFENSAYTKPRAKRKAYINKEVPWLTYGNLLSLPYRLVLALCDVGYLSRGEVIWRKRNPMPEGRCRRPHRQHESIYLLAKQENHSFRVMPPVGSVWEFGNEKIEGLAHFSRFPEELPRRCIMAYGKSGENVVVLDPFSGSGTTGIATLKLGCSYIGFEIDPQQVQASNERLRCVFEEDAPLLRRAVS